MANANPIRRMLAMSMFVLMAPGIAVRAQDSIAILNHDSRVNCVIFSLDGCFAITGDNEGVVTLWDVKTWKPSSHLKSHKGGITSIAALDKNTIVTSSQDKTIIIWDTAAHKPRHTLKGHGWTVQAVSISPDKTILGSCGLDGDVRTWDIQSGKLLAVYRKRDALLYAIGFSPDGKSLAVGGDPRSLLVLPTKDLKEAITLTGHKGIVASLQFGEARGRLISASLEGDIIVWNLLADKKCAAAYNCTDGITCMRVSNDGTLLATGCTDRCVRFWDPATGKVINMVRGHTEFIFGMAFSPDGSLLATASKDKTSRVWKTPKAFNPNVPGQKPIQPDH